MKLTQMNNIEYRRISMQRKFANMSYYGHNLRSIAGIQNRFQNPIMQVWNVKK